MTSSSADGSTLGSTVLPGQTARLGGRTVHWVHQTGTQPAVLFLGGCGVPFYAWDDVVSQLHDLEMVRLDRPGLAGTRWPGVLPQLRDEVATCRELIQRLGGPAIVVGHSMGGLHAEALARQHPELVAGLLLLDSSFEMTPRRPLGGRGWLLAAKAVRASMRLRPLRSLGPLADRALVALQSRRRRMLDSTPAWQQEVYAEPDAAASVVAEQAAYGSQVWDLARLRARLPMPGCPVLVLTAAADENESWVRKQAALADLVGGRQIVVDDSRHLIMIDRPELVADAVRALRGQVGEDD